MIKRKRILLVTILILGLTLVPLVENGQTASAAPEPIYVDADASGADDGSSWADAYVDLQDALAAASGRKVWVAEGVYVPGGAGARTVTFQLENGVRVYGGFAGTESSLSQRDWETHVTILSGDIDGNDTTDALGVVTHTDHITGSNAYHVVTGSGTDATAVLDGFTITGGYAENNASPDSLGGGMYIFNSSPTLANLTFRGNRALAMGGGMYNDSSNPTLINVTFGDNSAYTGGGMRNANSDPTLTNVTFSDNNAYNGGGMNNYLSDPTLTNVIFSGNSASIAGGGVYNYDSNPWLTNVVFSGNDAGSGGGMDNEGDSNPVLTNVTFSGNSATTGGGMSNVSGSDPDLYNCILWGNSAGASGDQIANSSSIPAIYYSLIQGSGGSASWDASLGIDGGGNVDADPQFIDADGLDDVLGTLDDNLRLEGDSPAVDAGDNGWLVVTTDLDYHVRRVDMPKADTGSGSAPIVDMGAYEAHVLYVDNQVPMGGTNDGSSWADAYNDLQDGLAAAAADTEIWVADGIYYPAQWTFNAKGDPVPPDPAVAFELIDGVALYGGFAGNEGARDQRDWRANVTVLSGDVDFNDTTDANGVVTDTAGIVGSNAYHVVDGSSADSSAVLDGFTITAGSADGGGTSGNGAGMYINSGSSTLRNLVFSGNLASGNGGGMYNLQGDPTLSSVVFAGNHANSMGGGLFNFEGDITLINTSFVGNSAGSGGGGAYSSDGSLSLTNGVFSSNSANVGGGLYNLRNDATLTNVTFSSNVGTVHGGGILAYESGAVILTNCILWYNGFHNMAGATSTVSYSLLPGNCPSGSTCDHLLSADPEFVDANGADDVPGTPDDDLRLKFNSPAIDAGDNLAVPIGITTDLDGAARFVDVESVPDTGSGSAPIVDMGAYEAAFQAVYLPLVLR